MNGYRYGLTRWMGAFFVLVALCGAKVSLGQSTRPTDASPVIQRAALDDQPIRRNGQAVPTTQGAVTVRSNPWEYTQVALALAGVLALIFFLRHLGRKALRLPQVGSASAVVNILGATAVGPRQHIMLLHVGRRVLVVSNDAGRMTSLGEITDPDEIAELMGRLRNTRSSLTAGGFGRLLDRFRGGSRDASDGDAVASEPSRQGPDRQSGRQSMGQVDLTVGDEPAEATPDAASPSLQKLMARIRTLSEQLGGSEGGAEGKGRSA